MDKLTYVFKGSYLNRDNDKDFIRSIVSNFNPDQVTGIGAKVNNNPWKLEVFLFVTIDTIYLGRDEFNRWLKNNHNERTITHNIFLGQINTSGNISTFINELSLLSFDWLFIFSEEEASLFYRYDYLPTLLFGLRSIFEEKHPQYKSTEQSIPAVFISHSSYDKDSIALPISDYLCIKEISIWLDRNEISPDDIQNDKKLYEKIYNGISLCKTGIFIVTKNFLEKSEWVKKEISICKDLKKNMMFLIFDKNLNTEELKENFSLPESSFILINKNHYEDIRKALLERNYI